jgi:hypothetical protein
MIGGPGVNVTATTRDGGEVPVLIDGQWETRDLIVRADVGPAPATGLRTGRRSLGSGAFRRVGWKGIEYSGVTRASRALCDSFCEP